MSRRTRRIEGGKNMRMPAAIGAAALIIGVGVIALAQETQQLPGFGTGIVKVAGTVDIGNTPLVIAHQAGEWKMVVTNPVDVRVANTPTVSVASPDFVRKGSRYEITWSTGDRQQISVVELGPGAWMKVDAGAKQRWVNLSSARAIDEVP
jgi:hypothetical protein